MNVQGPKPTALALAFAFLLTNAVASVAQSRAGVIEKVLQLAVPSADQWRASVIWLDTASVAVAARQLGLEPPSRRSLEAVFPGRVVRPVAGLPEVVMRGTAADTGYQALRKAHVTGDGSGTVPPGRRVTWIKDAGVYIALRDVAAHGDSVSIASVTSMTLWNFVQLGSDRREYLAVRQGTDWNLSRRYPVRKP